MQRSLTFCQMSSNCSTPSATFFKHLSISPVGMITGFNITAQHQRKKLCIRCQAGWTVWRVDLWTTLLSAAVLPWSFLLSAMALTTTMSTFRLSHSQLCTGNKTCVSVHRSNTTQTLSRATSTSVSWRVELTLTPSSCPLNASCTCDAIFPQFKHISTHNFSVVACLSLYFYERRLSWCEPHNWHGCLATKISHLAC